MSSEGKAALTNHKATNYNTHANFVYSDKYTSAVLELLDPQPGESIVDLGCGTGQLTERIKQAVGATGVVVGIDSSDDMLKHARTNGELLGITYVKGDIQDWSTLADTALESKFDKVFSSATLHWCRRNPGGVVETIKHLVRPGGLMAFEFGGFGNTVGVRSALHQVVRSRGVDPETVDPWYFPTADQYISLLKEHGLEPGQIALYPRPTPLPTDIIGWLKTFARNTFFVSFDDAEADVLMKEVQELCRPDAFWNSETPGRGVPLSAGSSAANGWEIMYVRIRGTATLPKA